jgi:ADP-ribosyl-[dinitrogen reductase] hydrolase
VTTRSDRIAGGLWGLLVGDAVGVPYEFRTPDRLPPKGSLEMVPPTDFRRAHAGTPPGTWSDDGAQALCLLASLLECDGFSAANFAEKLVAWRREGYMAVDGRVFDVGVQTDAVLRRIADGVPLEEASARDERSNGNGSLMRALPLALWHTGSEEALVATAHAQSRVTHAHPRSEACVALYSLWARAELDGVPDAWRFAADELRLIYELGSSVHLVELREEILPYAPSPSGSGYVLDCLHSARKACEATTFVDVVQGAIALGNDTDTTACVAGGIAGIRFGLQGIPERWLEGLRGRELVMPLLERLLQRSIADS